MHLNDLHEWKASDTLKPHGITVSAIKSTKAKQPAVKSSIRLLGMDIPLRSPGKSWNKQ